MIMDLNFLYTPQERETIKNTLQNLIETIHHQQLVVQSFREEQPNRIKSIKNQVEKRFQDVLKHIKLDEKILKKSREMKWIKLIEQDLGVTMSIDKDYLTYLVYHPPKENIDFMIQIREYIKNANIPDNMAEIDQLLQKYEFNVLREQLPNPDYDELDIYETVKLIEKYRKYIVKYQQFALMVNEIQEINTNHYKIQSNSLVQGIVNITPFKAEGGQNQEFNYIQVEAIQYEEFLIEKKYLKQYEFTKIKENGNLTSNYNFYKKVKATIIVNAVLKTIFVVNTFKHYKEIPILIENILKLNVNFRVMYFRVAHPLSRNNNDTELSLLYEVLKYIKRNKLSFNINPDFYQLIYKEQVSEFRMWLVENYNIEQTHIKAIQDKIGKVLHKEIKAQDIYKYIVSVDVVKKFKQFNAFNQRMLIIDQDKIEEHMKNEEETLIVQNKFKEIDRVIRRVEKNMYLTYSDQQYRYTKLIQTNIQPMLAIVAQFYLSYIDNKDIQVFKQFLELQPKGIAKVVEQLKVE